MNMEKYNEYDEACDNADWMEEVRDKLNEVVDLAERVGMRSVGTLTKR